MFLCFPKLVGMFRAPSLTFAGLFSLLLLFGTQLQGIKGVTEKWFDLIWFMKAEQIGGNLGKSLIFQIEPIMFLPPWDARRNPHLCTVCWKLKDLFVLLMEDSCLWPWVRTLPGCRRQFQLSSLAPINTPDLPEEGFACSPIFLTHNQNKFSVISYMKQWV